MYYVDSCPESGARRPNPSIASDDDQHIRSRPMVELWLGRRMKDKYLRFPYPPFPNWWSGGHSKLADVTHRPTPEPVMEKDIGSLGKLEDPEQNDTPSKEEPPFLVGHNRVPVVIPRRVPTVPTPRSGNAKTIPLPLNDGYQVDGACHRRREKRLVRAARLHPTVSSAFARSGPSSVVCMYKNLIDPSFGTGAILPDPRYHAEPGRR